MPSEVNRGGGGPTRECPTTRFGGDGTLRLIERVAVIEDEQRAKVLRFERCDLFQADLVNLVGRERQYPKHQVRHDFCRSPHSYCGSAELVF